MPIIKVWNPRTKQYEAVSVSQASDIPVNSPSFRGNNVEAVLHELNNKVNVIQKNVAYMYQQGTLGGGGGSGGGSGSSSSAGDHVIVPINFNETGTTYFDTNSDVVLKFSIKTSLSSRFNITVSSSVANKSATGKMGQTISVNLGRIETPGSYAVTITGSTASGAMLDPLIVNIRIARFEVYTTYDSSLSYKPQDTIYVPITAYSDYTSQLLLEYKIDGGAVKQITEGQVVGNATFTRNSTIEIAVNSDHKFTAGSHTLSVTLFTTNADGAQIQSQTKTIGILIASEGLMVTIDPTSENTFSNAGSIDLTYNIIREVQGVFDLYYEILDGQNAHVAGSTFIGNKLDVPGNKIGSNLAVGTHYLHFLYLR